MKAIFITGTDTGVGKTLVTGLVARYILAGGRNVITQKWIETGSSGFSRDIECHLKLMGKKIEDIEDYRAHVAPYTFRFASSPHLASDLEKKRISKEKIKKSFLTLRHNFDFVIVEGIGGVFVPYNKKRLVLDIAQELRLPVLLVVGNKLGAINHTLLTIGALRRRKMHIIGIIYNTIDRKTDKKILRDNIKIIRRISGVRTLGTLPYIAGNFTKAAISKFKLRRLGI